MPPEIGRFVTQEGREILARMGVEVDGLPELVVPEKAGLGVAVEKPEGLRVTNYEGLDNYGDERLKERRITREEVDEAVANPVLVLKQGGGRYYFLGQYQAVVVDEMGNLITAYNRVPKTKYDGYRDYIMDLIQTLEVK